jgi:LCP family protein required for cell wall assembly
MEGLFPDVTWPGNDEDPNNDLTIDEAFKDSKIINIALIGYDMNEERSNERVKGHPGLADSIMVAAINIETGETNIVSIPRDTLTPIYNTGGWKDKINSASYWGWVNAKEDRAAAGMKSQLETISIALGGVPIHYYVTVNMESVIEVVDIMGGVWFDVEHNVYDKRGKLVVNKGYQKLNGNLFMRFVRNRNFAEGDYGRAKNQQAIMLEAFSQFKKADKLVYAPQVFSSIKDDITTNLSLEQIMALALFGTKTINPQDISTHVMQGTYKVGGIPGRREANSYYIIDQQARSELIRSIWGIVIHPGPTDVLLPPLEAPTDSSSGPSDFPDPDENPNFPPDWEDGGTDMGISEP